MLAAAFLIAWTDFVETAQFRLHADIEQRHWWFVARRLIIRDLLAASLPAAADRLVVDIGCGTGANLASLASEYRCLGVDSSPEAVALARQRFPAVEFRTGQAPEAIGTAWPEARAVLLMDVLEHVDDDHAMFASIWQAAPIGCVFVITVPADPRLWSPHDEAFGHFRRYTSDRLVDLWRTLPAETLLVSHFNARLLPLIRWARRFARFKGRAGGQAGTDFRMPARGINALLTRIFYGERHRLLAALSGRRPSGYRAGASLVALLRKANGTIRD